MNKQYQQRKVQTKNEEDDNKKIKIISDKEISSLVLLRYLHRRRIPVDVAVKYCRQIDYALYGKTCPAMSFKIKPLAANYLMKI